MRLDGLPALALIAGTGLAVGVLLVLSVWAWPPRSPASRRIHSTRKPGVGRSPRATVMALSVVIGIMVGAATLALSNVLGLAIVCAVGAAAVPALVRKRSAMKERIAMRTLWPDVVDSLVSSLRAGGSLPTAIAGLTTLSPRMVATAAVEFDRQYRVTGNFDACLDVMKVTWADPAADRILETLRLARHVGGSDVTSILRTLGGYLRQESALRQEVEARQGWIRTAARIGVIAPWIVLVLLSLRPEAAAAYNSPAGLTIICVGFAITIVAYRIMLAVGILPEPRRWFA